MITVGDCRHCDGTALMNKCRIPGPYVYVSESHFAPTHLVLDRLAHAPELCLHSVKFVQGTVEPEMPH